jgi:hypothetical protein
MLSLLPLDSLDRNRLVRYDLQTSLANKAPCLLPQIHVFSGDTHTKDTACDTQRPFPLDTHK